jgi:protein-L-isoaspartate(D-aspartate) O-methyltransferase
VPGTPPQRPADGPDPARTAIDSALRLAPRERFLPESQRGLAGADRPLQIGHGQTSSQPRTVVDMLRLLGARPGMRVLDVGAGSGWTTALLAYLVGPTGEVLGLELEPELAAWGAANVRAADVPWARLEPAEPGVLGRPGQGPYDRVLVSAEARRLPTELVDQLVVGGVMVIPVAGRMLKVTRTSGSPGAEPRVERHGHYRFVPLR